LSTILSVPVAAPADSGRNDTLMLQLLPALRVPGQLLLWTNPALTLMLAIVSAAGPFEVSLTVLPPLVLPAAMSPKDRLIGDNVGAEFTPLPDMATPVGLVGASLVIVSVPDLVPSD
jgi:hypothetical protein